MEESFLLLFIVINLFSLSSPTSLVNPPLCHHEDSSALLQFRESFVTDMCASNDTFTYSKTESWKIDGSDCCSWDGVECNKLTGRVIGLDLGNGCLYGSINSSSSLFHLVHLRHLNLAHNHFNYSPIPSEIGRLSRLTHLNLSTSFFSGPIPSNISQLSRLSLLDLSDYSGLSELMLEKPDFGNLVQNLTTLEYLDLRSVTVTSHVPQILANFSSLKKLGLYGCGLSGDFPEDVIKLPNLQILILSSNEGLSGHLPEFNSSSPLQVLQLSRTNFSGQIPASIGDLGSLHTFSIRTCSFSGPIPTSFGNLKQLVYLDLCENYFDSQNFSSLSWLAKKTSLTLLGLCGISLGGEIPVYFANLTQLDTLLLYNCRITGQIPPWLAQMTLLTYLDLSFNQLKGPIPDSIFQLENIRTLHLGNNKLSGIVKFDMFLKLTKLERLLLSANNLTLLTEVNANVTRKFLVIAFASCNLHGFPYFLKDQHHLQWLDLSNNNLQGQIPEWVWNRSRDTLEYIDLSDNFLVGFELNPIVFPWSRANLLNISHNMLQGPVPVPPPSIQIYDASDNNFTGEIPFMICSLSSLYLLDLSRNNLNGKLPQCLGNFSVSLQLLSLGGNNFHGKIPQTHTIDCSLRNLMLPLNQLEGPVPRSLANCTRLEFLVLSDNKIIDVFPYWLGGLPQLKVLSLQSNHFQGTLASRHETNPMFPKLKILDLSRNNFSGQLPAEYFINWSAMRISDAQKLSYMLQHLSSAFSKNFWLSADFIYSLSLTTKGSVLDYNRILEFFAVVDLSSNRFEGDIPQAIGNLNGVISLNLSNNMLSGSIPTSLENLTQLESLDLSHNNLSGQIPQQLKQLNFLAVFVVSHNHLTGPIPRGKQFDTFENSSYEGNSGLCGYPLSWKCEELTTEQDEESSSKFKFGWKPILMGYACGLLVGLLVGHIVITVHYGWFAETFRVVPQRKRRTTNRRRRN
ncbi:hypothetical protein K2173_016388 [Erythroxylum novogranatense]|uniref:Leucine-rich repeat-containing N-terminal plant-type domain-containing protein n=1 Tax=Erythroxylum novogranatense TaxID=1862640 RepID=A0AAV8SG28_9ROSI|nr:hypothetical protein K2173_016388 [Erythroxylum novogranatense]